MEWCRWEGVKLQTSSTRLGWLEGVETGTTTQRRRFTGPIWTRSTTSENFSIHSFYFTLDRTLAAGVNPRALKAFNKFDIELIVRRNAVGGNELGTVMRERGGE